MTRLLHRGARVTVAVPKADTKAPSGLSLFEIDGTTVVQISDQRVTFKVTKTLKKEPNACDLSVWNLSEVSRGEFTRKPLHVRLEAGYDGELERLFAGDAIFVESKHSGTEWETAVQVCDGARAYQHARVNRSFKAGVTVGAVVREIGAAMGLSVPPLDGLNSAMATQFVSGYAICGPARREMTRLLAPHDIGWSIQDGRLQLLTPTGTLVEEPSVVSQDSGLIGSPEFGKPEKKGGKQVLKFQTLLRPYLAPGHKVRMDAARVKGVFRLEHVEHAGDTHGQDWTTTYEATEVAAA